MEELYYRYNPWWEEEYSPEGIIERENLTAEIKKRLELPSIVILTGLRRVGKTTLMRTAIKMLIDQGINPKNIFYISLDEYLLGEKKISQIIDEYRALQKLKYKEKVYLFFDEITYQPDFELQLKNIYDAQNTKIIVSSSSASFLKNHQPFLTGRSTIFEVLPLDFEEYLHFRNIIVTKEDSHLIQGYFEEFMKTGGMPEYVLRKDPNYLTNLVNDIISKDIIAAYGIKDAQILKNYFLLLMERSGKTFSLNKMANILGISADTARRYLTLFENTYLIYVVPRYGKTNDTLLSPKKIYAADLGFRTSQTGLRDLGSLFENYIYLKLRHLNLKYYYEDGKEIDFMTENKSLVEVKYGLPMNAGQQKLFEIVEANKKFVIDGVKDLEKIKDIE